MLKETITCLIIIISIFIFDTKTQCYTEQSVGETSTRLEELREKIIENEEDDSINKNINDIYDKWMEFHDKLAFYIEHDELEKVETQMVGVKGNIEVGEYNMAINELDKCIFILDHIKDKYKFSVDNIF